MLVKEKYPEFIARVKAALVERGMDLTEEELDASLVFVERQVEQGYVPPFDASDFAEFMMGLTWGLRNNPKFCKAPLRCAVCGCPTTHDPYLKMGHLMELDNRCLKHAIQYLKVALARLTKLAEEEER